MATADAPTFADNIKSLGDKIVALSLLDAPALSTYLKDTYGIEAGRGRRG